MFDENEQNNESSTYSCKPEDSSFTVNPTVSPVSPVQPDAPKARKKKSGMTGGKVVALALSCAVLGGAAGAGGIYAIENSRSNNVAEAVETTPDPTAGTVILQGSRDAAVLATAQVDTSKQMTAAEVYAANVNSTVGIRTSITSTNYWGYSTTSAASGSGFIVSSDGYILTNYHVVEDSNSITVSTYDGKEYNATLIGYDEGNDIAVLKIDADEALVPVILGDSEQLNVGDSVVAIGNPLGELTFSLTSGVVSALNREITFSDGSSMNLIQTDCAINSGNSGGALFNLYGEVVGITNAKYGSSSSSSTASIDNIGFAIPINSVRSIVESIIEKGYIEKPYIGVSITTVSEEIQSYGFPQGAAVKAVTEGSPAAEAGLEVNDIITAVNGTDISSSTDLTTYVSGCNPGDVLNLTVYRQSENDTLSITVTVGAQQQSALANEENADDSDTQQQDQSSNPYGYGYGYGYGNGYPFGYGSMG